MRSCVAVAFMLTKPARTFHMQLIPRACSEKQRDVSSRKPALLAALCAASLQMAPMPALAAPTVNEAIVEVSQASYPILKALKSETFGPFSEKVSNLILDIRPEKLGKTIDLAVDVFNSVPPEKVKTFDSAVKVAFEGLSPTSCSLVPLPSASITPKFSAVAASKVDPSKLKEFDEKWGGIITALPKTEAAICLPPVDKLTDLALAQAEIGRAFGSEESQRFTGYTTPLLKSSFTLGKVLPLVNDAKRLTPTATPREITAFQNAGKRVEAASAAEAQRARLAQLKERSECTLWWSACFRVGDISAYPPPCFARHAFIREMMRLTPPPRLGSHLIT